MMRKTLFFLLAFGGYWVANAQSENIATLEAQLARSSDPVESIRLLEQLTNAMLPADLKRAETYAAQALQLAGQSNSAFVDATAFLIAGKTLSQISKPDSANMFLDRALAGFERLNEPSRTAETLYWKGYIAANRNEFSAASRHYFRAVEIWEKSGQQKEIAKTYSSLSDMFSMQNAYDKAVEYAQKAIGILEALGETMLLATAFDNLSYCYSMSENHEKALQYADKALLIYEQSNGDEINIARTLNTRGNALKFLGRYEEAITDYERSRDICEKHSVVRGVLAGTANIGHVLVMQKKYAEALPYTLKAIEMMTQAGDVRNLAENYLHASNIYAGLRDFENANRYAWLYTAEKERQHEEKVEQLNQGLAEKYEAGQRAATITLQEQRIQQQTMTQRLMFGVAGLLILALILGWRSYRLKQRSNRLLEIKNRENELLLKEIHHRVKNNLQTISSLLSLQSESIQDPSAWDAIQESKNRVNSMALLHQKLYQRENLAAIEMRDYFETIGKTILDSFGEKAENVSLHIEMPALELDVDTAIPVGLITNELITNSLKHAFPGQKKGKIAINLTTDENNMLQLHISDNGHANANEGAPKDGGSFGTLLVQLLTAQLGGQLEKLTKEGTATTIRFPRQEKSAA
jgi:two-component sensor histidine kinase